MIQDITHPTDNLELLDTAIHEMEDFLCALREGNEVLDTLEEIPFSGDILPPPRIPASSSPACWQLGIFGHGLQSLRFYCHWESRRLTFDFLLPYERVLTSPEHYQAQRKCLAGCCFLALAFLLSERDGISYSPNDAEAGLRVTCDNDKLLYLIHNGETVLRRGDDWRELEPLLDCRRRAGDSFRKEDWMIFIP